LERLNIEYKTYEPRMKELERKEATVDKVISDHRQA